MGTDRVKVEPGEGRFVRKTLIDNWKEMSVKGIKGLNYK
jgi:hypothetical protein